MTEPPLANASLEDLVGQVADEIMERRRRGEQPNVDEYAARHPAIASVLRQMLPALLEIGQLGCEVAPYGSARLAGPTDGVLGDFRIVRELGRGGMGVVYEAEQISLGRRVALKVLPFAATMDARQLQRFQNEARAAAGLHHTNIVAVHYVGCQRGVHYYAMQYIEGRDLASVIAQLREQAGQKVPDSRHVATVDAADGESLTPSSATEPLAGLSTQRSTKAAEHFRAVARLGIQAAEALDHAHQLGIVHRDIKPANLLIDNAGRLWVTDFGLAQIQSDTRLTLTGDLIGTLRYMSPEQALAKRVVVDHRTDVYSLGATLYELLTLEPAFNGSDRQELLRQIAFEEPRRPRQWNKAMPQELETIVLKALERNPADRYPTAQEMAEDLRRFLDGQLIRACRPTLRQRARKWASRHKALVGAVVSVLAMAVVILAASAGWLARDESLRRAETERVVGTALTESTSWQEKRRLPEALSAARRAAGLMDSGTADAALRRRVRARLADLELLAKLENVRLETTALKEDHFDREKGNSLYAETFREFGIDMDALPPEEAGERIRQTSVAVELAGMLDHWAWTRRYVRGLAATSWLHLLRAAQLADPDEERNRLREALEHENKQLLLDTAGGEEISRFHPATLAVLGLSLHQLGAGQEAEALLRKAQRRYPEDFWINEQLGWFYQHSQSPRPDEATRFLTVAVSVRPQSPGAHLNLGDSLRKQGDLDGAIAEYNEAIRLEQEYAAAYCSLGSLLNDDKGKPAEAEEAFRRAIALKPDYALAYRNLGIVLKAQKKLPEAVEAYHKAIALKPDYAEAYCGLGDALAAKKQLDEAIAEYRKAIQLHSKDALAHKNLGNALQDKNQLDEAIAEYHKAIELDPKLAAAHNNLGNALQDKNQLDEASAEYRKAIQLDPKDALAHNNLGTALKAKKQLDEAMVEYHKALELDPKFALAHNNLGNALKNKNQLDDAIAEYHKAIQLEPKLAAVHNNLGNALKAKKQLDEAIAEYHKAIELDPKLARVHINLGVALYGKEQLDEAIVEYHKALELDPKLAGAHHNLGDALKDKNQLDEAIAEYHKAIELDPKYPLAHHNLGKALAVKNQLDEAIAEFRKAIQLDPKLATAHDNLGVALHGKKQLDEAITEFRKAIQLDPKLAAAHNNLGAALYGKKQLDEAIAEFRKAIQLDPKLALAHGRLGQAWLLTGRFAEAKASTQQALQLLPDKHPQRPLVVLLLQQCNGLLALEAKLSEVLAGKADPADNGERLGLIEVCRLQQRHVAAVRLSADAFAAEPKLADDLKASHRYNAACDAALAGCGQGKDADTLDDKERARLRQQVRDWLRADLTAWSNLLVQDADKNGPAVAQNMQHWLSDTDFNGVRGAEALAKLPEAERGDWQRLWEEVQALHRRTQAKKN